MSEFGTYRTSSVSDQSPLSTRRRGQKPTSEGKDGDIIWWSKGRSWKTQSLTLRWREGPRRLGKKHRRKLVKDVIERLMAATEPQPCGHWRRKSRAPGETAEGSKRIIEGRRELLMVRVLFYSYLLLTTMLSSTCSALEIQRVTACSGIVLRLRGDFGVGDYARFKSQFGQKDAVIGVDLSSTGGDLEEGVQIATLARQKKLSVYVSKECSSVCAFIFFAATKRYVAKDSKIGVHSVSDNRDIEDLSSMRLTLKLARLLAKLGVPNSTIGKMVITRPSTITWLDAADLSGLRASAGNPFHYDRPEKSSRTPKQQQRGCSG
jgi:hypothetical protein